jgi:hypothetical protein
VTEFLERESKMFLQNESDEREYCLLWYITLENTEGAIKKGKSKETGNIGYTR